MRIRCFATRKGADFRFLFHLFSCYRVSLVIPGARPRGRWKCRLPVPLKALRSHASDDERFCRDAHPLLRNTQRSRLPVLIPFILPLPRLPCHSGSATQG
ncbi:hypothetical protein NDU88_003094 [Pleurodeles waltl]|uniref:Uncharacterized protein n=1 Tax=Pleurodeles waltl TaxID=8319 RepID=A0AAV7SF74_PLEWA|nr:hypothetical protein NDU88_003094 [Pleurodeles waltl]